MYILYYQYIAFFREDSDIVIHSSDPIVAVGYLTFKKLSLELKLPPLDLQDRLEGLPLKNCDGYLTDHEEAVFKSDEDIGKIIKVWFN